MSKKEKLFKLDFFKSRKQIKSESKSAVRDYYSTFVPMTLVAFLIVATPVAIAFLFKNLIVQICLWSLGLIFLNFMTYGYMNAQIRLAYDQIPKMKDLFSGFKRFFKVFFFGLYVLIIMAICSSLIVIPLFVVKNLPLWAKISCIVVSFVPTLLFIIAHYPMYFVLIENPKMKNGQIINQSRKLTEEKRWDLTVFVLSFFPKNILWLLTALIGQLWYMPYKWQCLTRFYFDLKTEI